MIALQILLFIYALVLFCVLFVTGVFYFAGLVSYALQGPKNTALGDTHFACWPLIVGAIIWPASPFIALYRKVKNV